MTHSRLMYSLACLLSLVATSAPDHAQAFDKNLPDAGELLNQASRHIDSLEAGLEQAYLYRRLAVLLARSQKLESAYSALTKIKIPKNQYPQTSANLKRVGFLEMVEEVSLVRDTQSAIKIVRECPDSYRAYSDDAYGHIALSASQRKDAKGAWLAVAAIKKPDGLYPYELVVAATLDDKARGKRILLDNHKALIASMKGQKLAAREQWTGMLWMLSFYKWCGLNEEFKQILDHACQMTTDSEKTRAQIMAYFKAGSKQSPAVPCRQKQKAKVSPREIRLLIKSVRSTKSHQGKAEKLLDAAKMILELERESKVVPRER